jgi:hypothetical protein
MPIIWGHDCNKKMILCKLILRSEEQYDNKFKMTRFLKMVCLILISKWFYTFCFISSKFSTSVSKTSDSDCSCCTLSCLYTVSYS